MDLTFGDLRAVDLECLCPGVCKGDQRRALGGGGVGFGRLYARLGELVWVVDLVTSDGPCGVRTVALNIALRESGGNASRGEQQATEQNSPSSSHVDTATG